MDIKSEVLKYIDLAEDTAKASLQLHLTDMSDQNYNESLELIKELRETVSGVWDNSTVAAMKKAKGVEDCILRWMKCASTMTCSTENVRELRSAVEKAREWGTLNKAAEGRGIFGLGKNKDTARAAEEDIKKGMTVILGGDFNEPSHLDWQENTRNLWDHNGAVINWDCSRMLTNAGFKDSYREKHPDPVSCPGFTFPAGNQKAQDAKLEILAWAPEADERDRIDFIYYISPDKSVSLTESSLVGPKETVIRGEIKPNTSKDSIITPECVWPSDHKGNFVVFKITDKRP